MIQGNRDAQLDLSQAQKGHHHGGAPLLHRPHLPPLSLHQTRTEYLRSIPGEKYTAFKVDISDITEHLDVDLRDHQELGRLGGQSHQVEPPDARHQLFQ